jgi:hypothetical protein
MQDLSDDVEGWPMTGQDRLSWLGCISSILMLSPTAAPSLRPLAEDNASDDVTVCLGVGLGNLLVVEPRHNGKYLPSTKQSDLQPTDSLLRDPRGMSPWKASLARRTSPQSVFNVLAIEMRLAHCYHVDEAGLYGGVARVLAEPATN